MEEDSAVDTNDSVARVEIELANSDDVRAYIRRVQMAIDDLEELLREAPPLRFAPKQTLKG